MHAGSQINECQPRNPANKHSIKSNIFHIVLSVSGQETNWPNKWYGHGRTSHTPPVALHSAKFDELDCALNPLKK